ncbi:PPPDE putative peptidase domain-containing protein [Choanephora cucurbitarum]|nr:PPPDE putative peptidase domain-containing protein [Choanephora cucurbitarum]
MGYTNLSQKEIDQVLQDISKEYVGTSYKLLTRNCNHFSEDLCKRLTGRTAPGWINRAAKLGTMFPCVIPTEWIEPPDADTSSPSSSSVASNAPLQHNKKSPPPIHTDNKRKSTNRRHSSSTDSIKLVRTPVLENDELDCSSPVKEPDTHRPEVIRSATQVSMTAPVEL